MNAQHIVLVLCMALCGTSFASKKDPLKKDPNAKKRRTAIQALDVKGPKKARLSADEKGMVVNGIAVVVHTDPAPIIITIKEVESPSINGQQRVLDDIIFERILAYEGEHVYHLSNTEDSARKYFEAIKKQNNLTDEQFKDLFTRLGKTPEEGFADFKAMYIAEQIISFKIKSRLVIPEENVKAYYQAHPQYEEAGYKLKRGFIAKGAMTDTELKEFQDSAKHSYKVDWSDPYWLEESEIAPARDFIKTMEPGEYSALEVVPGGYEVVKLVQKRLQHQKTFDECRAGIIEALQVPFYQEQLAKFRKELFDKYQITYFIQQ